MTTDSLPVWRTKKFANLTLSGVTGEGRFSGYASIFGEVDLGKDAIEPGAFSRSLSRRGAAGVRMLFQHDPGEPLGAWKTIREDARALCRGAAFARRSTRPGGTPADEGGGA